MKTGDVYFDQNTIYDLEDMSILGKLPSGSSEALYKYLYKMAESYTIEIAIMGFNHPLRNAVYTVFPKAIIIIDPLDVDQMISHYLGAQEIINGATEEVAAHSYRQWQGEVPLGVKSFHHVIRTIDYYYEEIFNYFKYKEVLSKKHYKIR